MDSNSSSIYEDCIEKKNFKKQYSRVNESSYYQDAQSKISNYEDCHELNKSKDKYNNNRSKDKIFRSNNGNYFSGNDKIDETHSFETPPHPALQGELGNKGCCHMPKCIVF